MAKRIKKAEKYIKSKKSSKKTHKMIKSNLEVLTKIKNSI